MFFQINLSPDSEMRFQQTRAHSKRNHLKIEKITFSMVGGGFFMLRRRFFQLQKNGKQATKQSSAEARKPSADR